MAAMLVQGAYGGFGAQWVDGAGRIVRHAVVASDREHAEALLDQWKREAERKHGPLTRVSFAD